jgi:hypothetical protein
VLYSAPLITNIEWELISGQDLFTPGHLPPVPPEPVDYFLKEKNPGNKNFKKELRLEVQAREQAGIRVRKMISLGEDSLLRVHRILGALRKLNRSQAGNAII